MSFELKHGFFDDWCFCSLVLQDEDTDPGNTTFAFWWRQQGSPYHLPVTCQQCLLIVFPPNMVFMLILDKVNIWSIWLLKFLLTTHHVREHYQTYKIPDLTNRPRWIHFRWTGHRSAWWRRCWRWWWAWWWAWCVNGWGSGMFWDRDRRRRPRGWSWW